jgi:hypothetical protein
MYDNEKLNTHILGISLIFTRMWLMRIEILSFYYYNIIIPVPGNIRLSTKQKQAKTRGIWGTARRNAPCLILLECPPLVFIDGRLLEDIDTWLRRVLRVVVLAVSVVRERFSSVLLGGDDGIFIFVVNSSFSTFLLTVFVI